MTQPQTVLSQKAFRKAVLKERGVTTATVAAEVPCSTEMVRHVFDGRYSWETAKIRRIKRVAAEQAKVPVADLWPDPDDEAERIERAEEPAP